MHSVSIIAKSYTLNASRLTVCRSREVNIFIFFITHLREYRQQIDSPDENQSKRYLGLFFNYTCNLSTTRN